MAFAMRLGFLSEHSQQDFEQRLLPKLPGCHIVEDTIPITDTQEVGESSHREDVGEVEPDQPVEEAGANADTEFTHWTRLTVSSPTMARDLCQQLLAYLNHNKQGGVLLEWSGGDGSAQSSLVSSQQKDAEVAAMRLSAALKAHNDAEKKTRV